MRRAVAAVVAALVALSGCGGAGSSAGTSSRPGASGGDGASAERGPGWPLSAQNLAVVAGDRKIGIWANGSIVTEMATPLLVNRFGSAGNTAVVDHRTLAIQIPEELIAVDLATGIVQRRPCGRCAGIAIVDDRLATIQPDHSLLLFERNLTLAATRRITPAHRPEASTEPFLGFPQVHGMFAGRIVVAARTEGTMRTGPSAVSLVRTDGEVEERWEVPGMVFSATPRPDGQALAVEVGGSSSACENRSRPVIVKPGTAEPHDLLPGVYDERDDGLTFSASDMWWNGDELIVLGAYWGFAESSEGCRREYATRRFGQDGPIGTIENNGTNQYRVVGDACDSALAADVDAEKDGLAVVHEGARTPVDGYSRILWTPARLQACDGLPGISQ